jgi:hypothetical protein
LLSGLFFLLTKTPLSHFGSGVLIAVVMEDLNFRDRDGFLVADLHAALAAKAFLGVDRHGFAVLYLIDVNRTYFHAFLASFTLIGIYCDFVRHLIFPPLYIFLKRKH